MTPLAIGVVALLTASACALALGAIGRIRRLRAYETRVGLDLPALVALLPAHLRTRQYTRYVVAPSSGPHLSVGLVYEDSLPRRGNPPNVGMDFDAERGALVRIHEDGIGLGIK